PVAAGVIDEGEVIVATLLAFVSFCLASSATYLFNDLRDVELDRQHPTKRNRPIAAGHVPIPLAWGLTIVMTAVSLAIGYLVDPALGLTVTGYLALTAAYNLGLKHVAPLDILAVAAGFVLRAVAGGAAADVPISEWFF